MKLGVVDVSAQRSAMMGGGDPVERVPYVGDDEPNGEDVAGDDPRVAESGGITQPRLRTTRGHLYGVRANCRRSRGKPKRRAAQARTSKPRVSNNFSTSSSSAAAAVALRGPRDAWT